MKVSELEGTKLDYWVARAQGEPWYFYQSRGGTAESPARAMPTFEEVQRTPEYRPSSDWSRGGPIIERERIELQTQIVGGEWLANACPADPQSGNYLWSGPTPLVAAMRCYVASKFGEGVPDAD